MPCSSCATEDGLEVCLYCGHPCCALHRGEAGGVTACSGCMRGEAERRRRTSSARSAPGRSVARGEPLQVQVTPAAPRPLPEPKSGVVPVVYALAAALPSGAYVYWMAGRLSSPEAPLADWVAPAGASAAALLAFAGVWAIARTRL